MPRCSSASLAIFTVMGDILRNCILGLHRISAAAPANLKSAYFSQIRPSLAQFLAEFGQIWHTLVQLQCVELIIYVKLDGQGRARREAARRRNFECKISLNSRNYSRSNGSRPTAVQRAVIGRRRRALVAAPRRRPVTGKEGVSEGDSI